MVRWIGKFPSLKLGRMVGFRSLVERDFIYLLDYAPSVSEYCEQPFPIHYKEEGKQKQYVPDFFFVCEDQKYLVACEQHAYVQPDKNNTKWEAARQWGFSNRVHFRVVTDQMIQVGHCLENIKLLTDFARYKIDTQTKTTMLHLFSEGQASMTVADLMAALTPKRPQASVNTILHLTYHHFLHISLVDDPITVASSVVLNQGVSERQQVLPVSLFT